MMPTYDGPLNERPALIPEHFGKSNVHDHPHRGFMSRITDFERVELVGVGGPTIGPFRLPGRIIKSYALQFQQYIPPVDGSSVVVQPRYAFEDELPLTQADWNFVLSTQTFVYVEAFEVYRPPLLYLQSVNKVGVHVMRFLTVTIMAEML